MKDDNQRPTPSPETNRTDEQRPQQTSVVPEREQQKEEKPEEKSAMDFAPGSGGGSAGDGAAA